MSADGVRKLKTAFLAKAREDFAVMKQLMAAMPELTAPIGFHAQQAVEKAVKAVMVAHGIRLIKVHDLRSLRAACQNAGVVFPDTKIDFDALSVFAVEWRYFQADAELPSFDFRAAAADIETILSWAEDEIGA